jgi:hypothetical protein
MMFLIPLGGPCLLGEDDGLLGTFRLANRPPGDNVLSDTV